MPEKTRRDLLIQTASATAAALLIPAGSAFAEEKEQKKAQENAKEPEVTATEDLMREHGVIRRALLVFDELSDKIRKNPGSVDPAPLNRVAKLFRTFGEDYHEKMLEEKHIFPVVYKMSGEAKAYVEILVGQHQRGREITDYILAVTNGPKISTQHAEPLAHVLQGFVRMYENHAAREDTIIFPEWKKNFTDKQLDELADQ